MNEIKELKKELKKMEIKLRYVLNELPMDYESEKNYEFYQEYGYPLSMSQKEYEEFFLDEETDKNKKKLSDKEVHKDLYGDYQKITDIMPDITPEEIMEIKPF